MSKEILGFGPARLVVDIDDFESVVDSRRFR
jgi:hypothetical protein